MLCCLAQSFLAPHSLSTDSYGCWPCQLCTRNYQVLLPSNVHVHTTRRLSFFFSPFTLHRLFLLFLHNTFMSSSILIKVCILLYACISFPSSRLIFSVPPFVIVISSAGRKSREKRRGDTYRYCRIGCTMSSLVKREKTKQRRRRRRRNEIVILLLLYLRARIIGERDVDNTNRLKREKGKTGILYFPRKIKCHVCSLRRPAMQ